MPSWPIHIALANKLKNKYHFTDDFILGNVMPDATNGFIIPDISHKIAHSVTHFNFEGPGKPPKNNIQKFLNVYYEKLDNPIIYGAYIHLLTDNFYNAYFHQNHVLDKKTAILKDGSKSDKITPWKLKQQEFSKFGNYLIYHRQLGNEIKKSEKVLNYIYEFNCQINQEDIQLIIEKVNSYINRDIKKLPEYTMFSQEELEKLFEDCYIYLENIIEGREKYYVGDKI